MKVCQVERRGEVQMDQHEDVLEVTYELGWLHVKNPHGTTSYPTSFIGEVRVFEEDDE